MLLAGLGFSSVALAVDSKDIFPEGQVEVLIEDHGVGGSSESKVTQLVSFVDVLPFDYCGMAP